MEHSLEEKYDALQRKYNRLEARYNEVVKENKKFSSELSSAKFRIDNELEPRIKQEKSAYDSYVTGGGADECMRYGMAGRCGLNCPLFGERDGCAEGIESMSNEDLLEYYYSHDAFEGSDIVRENLIARGLKKDVITIDIAYCQEQVDYAVHQAQINRKMAEAYAEILREKALEMQK